MSEKSVGEFPLSELVWSKEGSLKGGEVKRVVEWLIELNSDEDIRERFLISFPELIPAEEVWEVVYCKFQAFLKSKPTTSPHRVLNFLLKWVELEVVRDFLSKEKNEVMYSPLLKLIEKIPDADTANKLKLTIIRKAHRRVDDSNRKILRSRSEDDNFDLDREVDTFGRKNTLFTAKRTATKSQITSESFPPQKFNDDKKVKTSLSSPGTPKSQIREGTAKMQFSDIEEKTAAEQMTAIEARMFKKIQDKELLRIKEKMGGKNRNLAKNVFAMVERSNKVSFWVATEIVTQNELKARVAVLRKFIAIGEHLLTLNNFNGVMEIIGGLNYHAVSRLKSTWEALPSNALRIFENLNDTMDNKLNYKNYRAALKNASKGSVVPYLGVYLRDLTFAEENPDHIGAHDDKKCINFEKLLLIGDVMLQLRKFQESTYFFTPSDNVRDYLTKLITLPEEMLYKYSVLCEPLPNGTTISE